MFDQISAAYIIVAGAAYLLVSVARHICLRRHVNRLKHIDLVRWIGMGSPEPTFFRRYSEYVTTRPAQSAGTVPLTAYNDLSIWLKQRGFDHLSDAEISRNAERYRILGRVQFALAAMVVCAALYLRFAFHRAVP